jgi:hypothetical protein
MHAVNPESTIHEEGAKENTMNMGKQRIHHKHEKTKN